MGDGISGDAVIQIERIVKENEHGREVVIGGRKYATKPVHDPRKPENEPAALAMNTLQGLADFAKSNHDEYTKTRGLFALVKSPTEVVLHTGVFGELNQRATVARSTAVVPEFKFGAFYPAEAFTIALLSMFEGSRDRERVFRLTGTVEAGSSVKTADDGVTQVVATKRGITRAQEEVGSVVMLRPFATFGEVDQVERPFILRMRPGAQPDEPHSCALFESDGGRWRLEAIRRVKAWLAGEIQPVPVYG